MCTWGEVFIYVINVGQEQKGAKDCALSRGGGYGTNSVDHIALKYPAVGGCPEEKGGIILG